MFNNFKKLGIVLFLLIAVIGMSISTVSAGGEGDKVGEPNSLAIAFINTYHSNGVAVNGIQYTRKMWNMDYAVHIQTEEYDENWTEIAGRDEWKGAVSDDFIERFNPNTKNVRFYIASTAGSSLSWIIPADGSHYGGVCASLGYSGVFRLVGNNGFDTGWKKL
jgi:hypothetical protein